MVEPGDAEALADGIAKALNDPEKTLKRAELALAHCRDNFTKDVVVGKYLALYKRLI